MALSKVWVHAEVSDGTVAPITLEMLAKAQTSRTARVGLGVMLVIWFYSFGENLEILAYLIWPGLLVVGIATGERLRSPLARRLGA